MFKKEKGEYGYLTKSKKIDLIKMAIYIAVALAIVVVGLLLNKMSFQNIFTVVAIMFVLPWARVLVEFIMLFPYHTPDKAQYEQLLNAAGEGVIVASDLVITSTEKAMGLNFVAMGSGYVVGVISNEKQNADEIQKYLRKGIHNWSNQYRVKIYRKFEDLLQDVSKAEEKELPVEERTHVEEFVFSLVI